MTISVEARRRDLFATLDTMVAAVRDKAVVDIVFTVGAPPLERTCKTTWDELLARGWTTDERSYAETKYALSPAGWVEGILLRRSAYLEQRCGQLARALKATVKGRNADGLTVLSELVAQSQLPEGWVWNAVEGNLLACLYPGRGYDLPGFGDGIACHLFVPRTFGQEAL